MCSYMQKGKMQGQIQNCVTTYCTIYSVKALPQVCTENTVRGGDKYSTR